MYTQSRPRANVSKRNVVVVEKEEARVKWEGQRRAGKEKHIHSPCWLGSGVVEAQQEVQVQPLQGKRKWRALKARVFSLHF